MKWLRKLLGYPEAVPEVNIVKRLNNLTWELHGQTRYDPKSIVFSANFELDEMDRLILARAMEIEALARTKEGPLDRTTAPFARN